MPILRILFRLLSGYRNKIEPMRNDSFGKYSREIIKHYREDKNDTKPTTFSNDFKLMLTSWGSCPIRWGSSFSKLIATLPFKTNLKSSNSEFLEWWVDGTISGSDNEHWQTYRNLINPCLYKWDYILKLENIEEESKWLFAEFNITEVGYPPGNT